MRHACSALCANHFDLPSTHWIVHRDRDRDASDFVLSKTKGLVQLRMYHPHITAHPISLFFFHQLKPEIFGGEKSLQSLGKRKSASLPYAKFPKFSDRPNKARPRPNEIQPFQITPATRPHPPLEPPFSPPTSPPPSSPNNLRQQFPFEFVSFIATANRQVDLPFRAQLRTQDSRRHTRCFTSTLVAFTNNRFLPTDGPSSHDLPATKSN